MPETELRADARRNRDLLVDAARTMVLDEGADISLREVARRAGVGIGTLYRHFPDREALLEAALRDSLGASRAAAEAGLDAASPGDALLAWLERFARGSRAWCAVPGSVLTTLDGRDSGVHAASRALAEAVDRLLARAQDAGEIRPDVEAQDLISAAKAIGWMAEQGEEERAARILAVLRDGLRR